MRPLKAALFCLALLVLYAGGGWCATAPEVRGKLSLAYDEMESGRCDGALNYLEGIDSVEGDGDGLILEDVLWLKTSCLGNIGKFDAAASILEKSPARKYEWREEVWRHLILEWAMEATSRGDFKGAKDALSRGEASALEKHIFSAFSVVTANRQEFSALIDRGAEGPTPDGTELKILPLGSGPGKSGWVRACPSEAQTWWAEFVDCGKWMGHASEKLAEKGGAAWMRILPAQFAEAVNSEAAKLDMGLLQAEDGVLFSRDGFVFYMDLERQRKRAAVEGMGLKGGAMLAAAEADLELKYEKEFAAWIGGRDDGLALTVGPETFTVRHPETGRTSTFQYAEWAGFFREDRQAWEKLWGEVTAELGREKRAFRCFCGREMVVRETLTSHWDKLITSWKAEGVAAVLTAHCPLHWLLVTQETLDGWGITAKEAVALAGKQANETPWEISFERGNLKGADYVVLAGTGISGIARKPELLLGVLEALEGKSLGEETVKVWAPMPDALVIGNSSISSEVGFEGAKRAVSMIGEATGFNGPMRYADTVKLPKRAKGTFNLSSGE